MFVIYRFVHSVTTAWSISNELSSVWCSWWLSTTRCRTARISGNCIYYYSPV